MAESVTKAELADALFERLGLNKREAKDMVDCFFEEVREALERGEDVKLSGFGMFNLRTKSPRPGRNPKTGEKIHVPAKQVVSFDAGKVMARQINSERDNAIH